MTTATRSPARQGLEKSVFETTIPLAIRTTAGYSLYDGDGQTAGGFHLYGLDLLAAGVLHKNISFLFVYTPRIDEPAADYTGSANGTNPAQLAGIESANIVFSNIVRDKLNLRVGRFEPGFQMMSAKRSYYLLQPFEIYQLRRLAEQLRLLGQPHRGRGHREVQARPQVRAGLHQRDGGRSRQQQVERRLSAPWPRPSARAKDRRPASASASSAISAGSRRTSSAASCPPAATSTATPTRPISRIGGNISLNWKTFNFQGMAFQGADDMAFNELEPTLDYKFWGGIVQLDWAGLPNNRLVGSIMYNWVDPPDYDAARQVRALSGLVRYYLGSWYAVNVALHAEVTHRQVGAVTPVKDNLFTLLLDFDF